MESESLLGKLVSDPEGRRLFQREGLILEVTEAICEEMQHQGISRSELAIRLGKTKRYVTKVLSGRANLTLRTVADIFTALRVELRTHRVPIEM